VYRGRDRRLARWVAVKVIKPWWAEDPEWARSFEREAQLLASVSDPGIIQIFDVGEAPEGLYYVAELVDGESLARRLRRGRVAPAEACEIGLQLARALARAHSQRVVHRDVKPANVLITRDGRVKVGDFGVARLAESTTDAPVATIAGTPGYMAPEQASGGISSPATDVYGVGIVLYEMLAGHTPFGGKSAVELALRHVNDPPPPLETNTPRTLVRVVERALAKDPADRYRDGHELAAALSRVSVPTELDEDEQVAAVSGARQASTAARSGSPTTVTISRPAQAGGTGGQTADAAIPREPSEPVPPTRVKHPRPPRRNFHPAERRQRNALLALAVLLAAGMAVVALEIAPGHLSVPALQGMTRGQIITTAHRDGFDATFSRRYSNRPTGTAIGQNPAAGTRVGDGATVQATLSQGPRPVTVPPLVGASAASAQSSLSALKLRADVVQVPAPGVSTGTVTRQSPAAGMSLPPHSTVSLWAAEAPQLRPLTSFSSNGNGSSVPFRIRGRRWEIVYSMGFDGTCTFIFFCSGPSATVTNVGNGSTVDQFDLGEGSSENRIFKTGPGVYQISVSPGDDSANWRIQVDDYY
jgi:eukaryotic-like serine/threonine-protein kinase